MNKNTANVTPVTDAQALAKGQQILKDAQTRVYVGTRTSAQMREICEHAAKVAIKRSVIKGACLGAAIAFAAGVSLYLKNK